MWPCHVCVCVCVQTGEPHDVWYRCDHAAAAETDDTGSSCIQQRIISTAVPETPTVCHTASVWHTRFSLTGNAHTQHILLSNVSKTFLEHILIICEFFSCSRASLWAAPWSFIHHRVLCSARAEFLAQTSQTCWTLSAASLYRNLRRLWTHRHRRNTALILGAREKTSSFTSHRLCSAPRSFRDTLEVRLEASWRCYRTHLQSSSIGYPQTINNDA